MRELGRHRDVSNLGPDPGRHYVQELILPIFSVPSLLSREIGDKVQDVTNLRLDLRRQGVPEAVPLLPETLLPISDETIRPPDEVRRRTREVNPPRGNPFVEIVTPSLDRLPPTPGKQVNHQDAKTPTTSEDVLDIPIHCSPIEAASSLRESASRKATKRKVFRELFGKDSDSE